MDWGEFAVQWLHIFFGIFWFGGTLYANFVMIPAILTLPRDRQTPVINAITARGERIIPLVATATIVLGILRGTALGPIKDVGDLGTGYGLYWLIGLVAALATWAWGYLAIRPLGQRFARESAAWSGAADELPTELVALGNRLKVVALAETVGFLVIFTTMILMHFASEG
jgi:uncharacterized membrane protein